MVGVGIGVVVMIGMSCSMGLFGDIIIGLVEVGVRASYPNQMV